MEKVLTIVVPTYNMEKYLERCLSSLLISDKEAFNTLEVLVVNDGSKDNSSTIAHSFQDKYPDVFTTIDKDNGNYGSCINVALKIAKGKYIKILDADDCFNTNNFSDFIGFLCNTDADIIISDFITIDETGKTLSRITYNFESGEYYPIEYLFNLDEIQMHAVTIRKDILINMNYHQTEGISYTDQEWIFTPVAISKIFRYFGNTLYKYTLGRPGQTEDPLIVREKINEKILVFKKMAEVYTKGEWTEQEKKYLLKRLNAMGSCIYAPALILDFGNIDLVPVKELDIYISHLSEDIYNIISDLNAPIKIFKYKYVKDWRNSSYGLSTALKLIHYYKSLRNKILSWI